MPADRSSYPSEQADKYLLRLPDGLRPKIKAMAEQSNRSMNAQIVFMLGWAMDEMELTAGTYGKDTSDRPAGFLEDQLRKNQSILESLLKEVRKSEGKATDAPPEE